MPTRGLDNLRTHQLVDWTSHGLADATDRSICCFSCMIRICGHNTTKRITRLSVIYVYVHTQENINKWPKKQKLSTQSRRWHLQVVQSTSWQSASWCIRDLSSNPFIHKWNEPCDLSLTRAIPEHFRDEFLVIKRYTDLRLLYLLTSLVSSYEEQLRQREMLYQQQQQRLYQDVRDEKDRVAESARRQRADVDALQRKLEDTHANLMASVRTEYEATKAEQDKRHQVNNLTLIRTKSVCRRRTVPCNAVCCLHGQTSVGCTPNKPMLPLCAATTTPHEPQ